MTAPAAAGSLLAERDIATALVARIRKDDGAAEAELVRRYERRLRILLRSECRDPVAVDDLFQDTFRIVVAKVRAGQVRQPAKLSGFIRSLARNLVIEHYRRVAARRSSGDHELAALPSPRRDPLEDLLRAERGIFVNRVLSDMPSGRDRAVLFRLYVAEDEKGAICRDLRLTRLHFNRVMFRARKRYRALYLRKERSEATTTARISPAD